MIQRIGAALGAIVFVCVLATGCGPTLKDDMKAICEAGGSGQVVGASTLEGKTAGLKAYLDTHVKSDEGKAFVQELLAASTAEKITKLEAGIQEAGIKPNICTTLTLLKSLPAEQ